MATPPPPFPVLSLRISVKFGIEYRAEGKEGFKKVSDTSTALTNGLLKVDTRSEWWAGMLWALIWQMLKFLLYWINTFDSTSASDALSKESNDEDDVESKE